MPSDITQAVRDIYDRMWNSGDLTVPDRLCGPDYRGHLSLMGELDVDGLKQMVRTFRGAFPDLRIRVDELVAANNTVTVRWTATGTQRGDLMGIAPTGRSGSTEGIDLFRFDGDRIREHRGVWDVFAMLQNLGVAPALGGGTAGVQAPEATRPAPEARH